MEHFYTPKKFITKNSLVIEGDEAHHLKKVLRKNSGSIIRVTDGENSLYECSVEKISGDKIECKILSAVKETFEPKIKVHLYPALLKNPERFGFIIEKSVELGVHEIHPVISEHVVNKPPSPLRRGVGDEVKSADKTKRWNTISLSAMKQSQRCYLPKVNPPVDFESAFKNCKTDYTFLAHEKSSSFSSPLIFGKELFRSAGKFEMKPIAVFIGPEGGFSEKEIELAESYGAKIISLGKRKLRSETAAIIISSFLLSSVNSPLSSQERGKG